MAAVEVERFEKVDDPEEERDDGRGLRGDRGREVERAQERGCVQERGEEREDREDVHLRQEQQLGRVHVVPVPKLVCCRVFKSA